MLSWGSLLSAEVGVGAAAPLKASYTEQRVVQASEATPPNPSVGVPLQKGVRPGVHHLRASAHTHVSLLIKEWESLILPRSRPLAYIGRSGSGAGLSLSGIWSDSRRRADSTDPLCIRYPDPDPGRSCASTGSDG